MKAFGLLLLCVLPASAEVEVQSVQWQLVSHAQAKAAQPNDIAGLTLAAGKSIQGRLQARVKLINRGAALEGILLRYALSAKIGPADASVSPVVSVPFAIEEKRVPRIGANQYLEVVVDPTELVALYLKRLWRESYWPSDLRFQIMVVPRKGDKELLVFDNILPITP